MRIAIYTRVSTSEQTTSNQIRELEAVASARGWQIVARFEDNGISGAKGRDKRPGLDAMLKAATRREFDLTACWSVDRLGRSLQDLVSSLNELRAVGCGLYLHQQALDTTTPSGRAMFQMLGVFAEFERAMIQERVKAGMERAAERGTKSGRPIGRPRVSGRIRRDVRQLHASGLSKRAIARQLQVSDGTVRNILSATH